MKNLIKISGWNVSKVKDMSLCFVVENFNINLNKWDISSVTDMSFMFAGTKKMDQHFDWDLINVKYKDNMFFDCANAYYYYHQIKF